VWSDLPAGLPRPGSKQLVACMPFTRCEDSVGGGCQRVAVVGVWVVVYQMDSRASIF
jgi:hypothetical protein